jgi:hypothetical protein
MPRSPRPANSPTMPWRISSSLLNKASRNNQRV